MTTYLRFSYSIALLRKQRAIKKRKGKLFEIALSFSKKIRRIQIAEMIVFLLWKN